MAATLHRRLHRCRHHPCRVDIPRLGLVSREHRALVLVPSQSGRTQQAPIRRIPPRALARQPTSAPAHPCGGPSRYSGNPSGTTHSSRLPVWILTRGGTRFGLSRLAVVMPISSGKSACAPVSWVPHREQNDRTDFAVELNHVGWPLVMRNSIDLTLNMLRNGAPVVRRQIEQWQLVSRNGASSAS